MSSATRQAASLLRRAIDSGQQVAALTGAGVSAESGIPTFRGAGGLWQGYRAEELATPEAFQRDPAKVWEWYLWRRALILDAAPNPAHEALARLERVCDRFVLITQNVDGLHQRAGSRSVVELHGNIHHARCTVCGHVAPLSDEPRGADGAARDAREMVTCVECGALARPHIVWFGEMLPEERWQQAYAAAKEATVLLVVGTSAGVYPAAGLVDVTAAAGGAVIEVNPEATELSPRAAFTLRQPAGKALRALLREARIGPTEGV